MVPIQLYPGRLRATQGYLAKMPRAFVERWKELRTAADSLGEKSDELTVLGDVLPPLGAGRLPATGFRPKDGLRLCSDDPRR